MEKKYELGRLVELTEASRRKIVTEAWKNSGFLKGLKGRDQANMAVLCENQKKSLLKENNTTADMAVFDTVAIPMIRRQYRRMITPLLISVQPLSYSQGLAFFIDYNVSDTKKPIGRNHFANDLSGGQADNFAGNTFESVSAHDRHYDNQGFDTAKGRYIPRGWNPGTANFVNTTVGGPDDTASAAAFTKAAVPFTDAAGQTVISVIDFDLTGIDVSLRDLASFKVYDAAGTLVQGRDFYIQRVIQNYSDEILSTGRTANTGTTSTEGTAGGPGAPNKILRLRIIPAITTLAASTNINLRLGITEFLNLELNAAFSSELRFQVRKIQLETQIHKMKVAWTVELAEDMEAYHSIDAEQELTKMLSEETAAQKDRYIINELINGAGHFEVWNADFLNAVDPNPANTVFRGTESGYNQTLVHAMNRVDGMVRKSTNTSGINWVLISPEGYAKLQNLDTFMPVDVTEGQEANFEYALGVQRVGTVSSKYKVYVDPNLKSEVCLLGRKGETSYMDTGYVYAPYVEFMLSETIFDSQEANPMKMIRSRFATKMLNNKFYGIVWMKGITSFEVFQASTTV